MAGVDSIISCSGDRFADLFYESSHDVGKSSVGRRVEKHGVPFAFDVAFVVAVRRVLLRCAVCKVITFLAQHANEKKHTPIARCRVVPDASGLERLRTGRILPGRVLRTSPSNSFAGLREKSIVLAVQ